MRYEPKYNRLQAKDMYNDDWIIDSHGNLVMKEDYYTDEIDTESITFDSKT